MKMTPADVGLFKISTEVVHDGFNDIEFTGPDGKWIRTKYNVNILTASACIVAIEHLQPEITVADALSIAMNQIIMHTGIMTVYLSSGEETETSGADIFKDVWFLFPDFHKLRATPIVGGRDEYFILTCSLTKAFNVLDGRGMKHKVQRCPPI